MIRGLTLVLALMATTPGRTAESQYLKGVTAMSYGSIIEPNTRRCMIDWSTWNTSIDFVTRQTTKLKFLKFLLDARLREPELVVGDPEAMRRWYEKRQRAEFLPIPKLLFGISAIDAAGTCAALIDVSVWASLQPSLPTERIWWKVKPIRTTYQEFSEVAIKASEEMFQEFVNDWAASQKLP
jgi:hypothetical protein